MKKLKVGLVQERWYPEHSVHLAKLEAGIAEAAEKGAKLIALQELTLSPYFCTRPDVDGTVYSEDLETGPTQAFVAKMAKQYQVCMTTSLFEKVAGASKGFNTALAFNPQGERIAKTRKQHIPQGEGYHEDYYFEPGDSDYPVHTLAEHRVGLPTCYDQWFPELARIYGLKGAEILIYPTAIGSEPTAPGFDSARMWQRVMQGQAIAANAFMIAVNRVGTEDGLEFYGSSFICNPFGDILAQAPRHEPAVLVAELDFSERERWGRLFPFAAQRVPHTYHALV